MRRGARPSRLREGEASWPLPSQPGCQPPRAFLFVIEKGGTRKDRSRAANDPFEWRILRSLTLDESVPALVCDARARGARPAGQADAANRSLPALEAEVGAREARAANALVIRRTRLSEIASAAASGATALV